MTLYNDQHVDITVDGSTIGNTVGYTGRRWDAETGFWHYRNRAYSPKLGRFMQKDPAGYVDGFNLYAYVRNNPVVFVDPSGLMLREAGSEIQNVYNENIVPFVNEYAIPGLKLYSSSLYTSANIGLNGTLDRAEDLLFATELAINMIASEHKGEGEWSEAGEIWIG